MKARIRLRYFASLRDRAGCDEECIETEAADLAELYAERDHAHGLGWPREHLRVAVNGAFADWSHTLVQDDEVVFIPPVSGG